MDSSRAAAAVIQRPAIPGALIYDSPHSGRLYPPDFLLGAPLEEMRRGEDAFVDELLAEAPAHGATLLVNIYPRCYIDVNRAETDIDPTQLAEPWSGPVEPTEKTRRGLGLIRRFVVPGVDAQREPLRARDLQWRLDTVYRPYHDALRALLDEARARHGVAWLVDWHSMKSVGNAMTPDGDGARRPDFVVSDLHGRSAAPEFSGLVSKILRDLGYTVAMNDPYAGGTIVQRTGAPSTGVHSIQIEINRSLYLDEARVAKTGAFGSLAKDLMELTSRLSRAAMNT
jgi:N-formylglutamate deformylase